MKWFILGSLGWKRGNCYDRSGPIRVLLWLFFTHCTNQSYQSCFVSTFTFNKFPKSFLHLFLSQVDRTCIKDEICLLHSVCPSYQAKKSIMQQYPKNSGTYDRLLSEQRSTVCNRAEKGVCCENSRVHNSDRNQKFGLKEKSFEHENCGQFSESPSQVSFKNIQSVQYYFYLAKCTRDYKSLYPWLMVNLQRRSKRKKLRPSFI